MVDEYYNAHNYDYWSMNDIMAYIYVRNGLHISMTFIDDVAYRYDYQPLDEMGGPLIWLLM